MGENGVIRRIENDNRIAIPKYIIDNLKIEKNAPFEIVADTKNKKIILKYVENNDEEISNILYMTIMQLEKLKYNAKQPNQIEDILNALDEIKENLI